MTTPSPMEVIAELTEVAAEDEMILCEPWPELRRLFRQAASLLRRQAEALEAAESRAKKAEAERDEQESLKLAAYASNGQTLAWLEARCEAAESRVSALEAELTESRKLVSQYAREAGEAKGRLEISEAAGIVEGWRERAEKAGTRIKVLEAILRASPLLLPDKSQPQIWKGDPVLREFMRLSVDWALKAKAALNGEAGND